MITFKNNTLKIFFFSQNEENIGSHWFLLWAEPRDLNMQRFLTTKKHIFTGFPTVLNPLPDLLAFDIMPLL